MSDLWVTYDPPDDCQCWRNALCAHGWTWHLDDSEPPEPCSHTESWQPPHESLADAVRDLWSIRGRKAIACLVRERENEDWARYTGTTKAVYLLDRVPSGADDHEGLSDHDVRVLHVIERYPIARRTTARHDPDGRRRIAEEFR